MKNYKVLFCFVSFQFIAFPLHLAFWGVCRDFTKGLPWRNLGYHGSCQVPMGCMSIAFAFWGVSLGGERLHQFKLRCIGSHGSLHGLVTCHTVCLPPLYQLVSLSNYMSISAIILFTLSPLISGMCQAHKYEEYKIMLNHHIVIRGSSAWRRDQATDVHTAGNELIPWGGSHQGKFPSSRPCAANCAPVSEPVWHTGRTFTPLWVILQWGKWDKPLVHMMTM